MQEKHVWDKVNQWKDELEILKAILAKTELVETTKWGGLIYTLNDKNIVGIGGFKSYFGIWFMNGVFLNDKAQVLVNAQEGVTKALRQWRFNSKDEIDVALVSAYIDEAIENEKKGLRHKPIKKELVICEFFANELKNDTEFAKSFFSFSSYKKKEC